MSDSDENQEEFDDQPIWDLQDDNYIGSGSGNEGNVSSPAQSERYDDGKVVKNNFFHSFYIHKGVFGPADWWRCVFLAWWKLSRSAKLGQKTYRRVYFYIFRPPQHRVWPQICRFYV